MKKATRASNRSGIAGAAEDHERDPPPPSPPLPVFAFVLTADDAHGPLELLTIEPQFSIKRHIRQASDEPVGGRDTGCPGAQEELLAVPVCTNAVEFLAHPPAGQIDVSLSQRLGEEQRWSFTRRGFEASLNRLLSAGRRRREPPRPRRRAVAQVLAGAAVRWPPIGLRQAGQEQE